MTKVSIITDSLVRGVLHVVLHNNNAIVDSKYHSGTTYTRGLVPPAAIPCKL